ncbi:hypothetical protein [uncultured Chryseobacterium sp.]|uniref:hypothetical protein n=1 Tax=uncultured Chryseobacterium sp. TaxID=259322 RepID=UPI0025F63619|nr:hypothetical protein [uncultured Chryseobacterium sp.]
MQNELNDIGIGPSHIPAVQAGKYTVTARLDNELEKGNPQITEFHVAGYNHQIPHNEVLAVYPIHEGKGNYAGVFPHIQFRRSTLPWEYECHYNGEKLPYLFLVLIKEEEFEQNKAELSESNTDFLTGSLESERKTITLLKFEEGSYITPPPELTGSLAHVRIQKHKEIAALNLPEETSIVMAHRMVEPDTRYRIFVCYYANIEKHSGTISRTAAKTSCCVVLHEWSFESIGTELYQIDLKKMKNHPNFKDFSGIKDSEISDYEGLKNIISSNLENPSYRTLQRLMEENRKFLDKKKVRFNRFKAVLTENVTGNIEKENDLAHKLEEDQEKLEQHNNHILEYLEYNGKTLKGLLHELKIQAFTTHTITSHEAANRLLNIAKVPLEHQLKGGGKMISWYQGPFVNRKYTFDLEMFNGISEDRYLPDHADHLILFNEDTKMYDMTYASAWQLGRLMVMNDNKVLQELKKWKYDLSLQQLIEEQNRTTHLVKLSTDDSACQLPEVLADYTTGFLKFENFPLYYLFPHSDLSTEESCKYFKIDNSWLLAFLYGIFSAGPKLKTYIFKKYILQNETVKKAFNFETESYGIVIQSHIIKNWPHLIIELDRAFDFKFVTTINSTLRLYITDKNFNGIQMYLKNENAHFATEYPGVSAADTFITKKEAGYVIRGRTIPRGRLPFELLYKQPYVDFEIMQRTDILY